MRAKSKVASIFEIFFSTALFLIILFMAVTSLLAMNNSNKKAQAFEKSSDCSNEIKQKIESALSSNKADIYGLVKTPNGWEAKNIADLPEKRGDFSGIGLTIVKTPYEKRVIILKKQLEGKYYYFYLSLDLKNQISWDRDSLNQLIASEDFKKLNDCTAIQSKNDISLENPFFIAIIEPYKNDINTSYEVRIDDFIYSKLNNKIYSNLFLLQRSSHD